ncbi:Hsp20/alpha crystallin family protein [Wenzhouxiangella sp. AB-CW3]|uniref:Hsp20 family protein n=1 Tax=Wenzhouxiangella sp. AB-CW3 TaxID=2771012 RepID=UPI00168C07E1|nr:Hsp20/alpha crystallin family protein [Wenzhouxiangella sp. AB-CW3]QOC24101.1 Hsp20/alpha crystallin family protein [Wenzhouxiangella sp. AB-CW3]
MYPEDHKPAESAQAHSPEKRGRAGVSGVRGLNQAWSPPVDIIRDDNEYIVECDLPGLALGQIEVVLDRDMLMIQGLRTTGSERTERCERQERFSGRFLRSFRLPTDCRPGASTISLDAGVLVVRLHRVSRTEGASIPGGFQAMGTLPLLSDSLRHRFDSAWQPPVDLTGSDTCYHAVIEMPGVRPADVLVLAVGRTLVVRTVRHRPLLHQHGMPHRQERFFGAIDLRMTLPPDAAAHAFSWTLERGTLNLAVPRRLVY